MVPQGHLHHIPIAARGKISPRAVRNGSLRREGAAEAAFRGLGSRSAFFKNFVFSSNIVVGQRRRSPDLTTKWRARSAPFSRGEFERTAAPRTSPNSPRSVRAAPQGVPRGSRGAAATHPELGISSREPRGRDLVHEIRALDGVELLDLFHEVRELAEAPRQRLAVEDVVGDGRVAVGARRAAWARRRGSRARWSSARPTARLCCCFLIA